jgi:sigma-B regulation protein RsbU (phosphoserine phosphatase)
MMTARLAGLLSGASPAQNLALRLNTAGQRDAWPPHELAARLNRLMLDELQVEQYFTMAYAEFDVTTGKGVLVQAGHPHPVMLRHGGGIEVLGAGGLPIGLIPDVQFDQVDFRLNAGDRLFLISDGVTECRDATGNELGAEGLEKILKNNASLRSPDLLEALVGDLRLYAPKGDFSDDVSGLILDYRG